MITSIQIKTKLQEYLKREPTLNEITNGEKDQNIINSIIIDQMEDLNKTILDLQKQLSAIKK